MFKFRILHIFINLPTILTSVTNPKTRTPLYLNIFFTLSIPISISKDINWII